MSVLLKVKNLSANRKRLLSNFFSLSVLQGLNYIYPLITAPYLFRVLGGEKFGLVSFAAVFMTYFQLLTDYGFNLSATREISIHREDTAKVSEIYSSVMTIKAGLMVAGFIIMQLILWSFRTFRVDSLIYYVTFAGLIGSVLFPIWLFQGIERMKYITYLNLLSRTLLTILIFVFIRKESDFIKYAALNSAASIFIGLLSLWIIIRNFKIKYVLPTKSLLKKQILDGWYIFISTFSINMYINSNVLILGILTDKTVVGYYTIAEKCVIALRSIAGVIFQATYPFVCRKAEESAQQLKVFYKKITLPIFAVFFISGSLLFIFSGYIIHFFAGSRVPESITVLRMLSFVPLIVAMNIPAYQTLVAYGLKQSYTLILASGSALNILLNLILASRYKSSGTALSVLITELFITLGLYCILELRHKKYSILRRLNTDHER